MHNVILILKKYFIPIFVIISVIAYLFIITMNYNIPGTPIGSDANVYIMDSYSKIESGDYFTRYYSDYLNRSLYESPVHSLILIFTHKISGLGIEYPIFNIYQYTILVLIFLLIYIITNLLFDNVTGILATISSLGFYGLYFLFYSSTIANFSGVLIFLLLLLSFLIFKYRFQLFIIPIGLLLLYFTHKSLSFIFGLFTIIGILIIYSPLLWKKFLKLNVKLKILICILLILIISISIVYLIIPLKNTINPTNFDESGRFRELIQISTYFNVVGALMSIFFLMAPFIIKGLKLSVRKKIVINAMYIWVLLGIIFSLLPYFGIYFFSSRMFYMVWPFVYIISSFTFIYFVKKLPKILQSIIISIFIILVFYTSFTINSQIAEKTKFITESQVTALQFLKNNSKYGDTILTNENDIHPFNISVATRTFIRIGYDNIPKSLSTDYLIQNGIKYIYITDGDRYGHQIYEYEQIIKLLIDVEIIYNNDENLILKIK
ncbi:MAG: hypothetical protein Q8P20_02655 [bacterium]|nr:hypothetical protein [bacterium]